MANLGDAVRFFGPVSGSQGFQPTYMSTVRQYSSASLTIVAATASSIQVCGNNPNRLNLLLFNDSPSFCYISPTSPASTNNFSAIIAPVNLGASSNGKEAVSLPFAEGEGVYTGPIYAHWITTTGSMRVTELFA